MESRRGRVRGRFFCQSAVWWFKSITRRQLALVTPSNWVVFWFIDVCFLIKCWYKSRMPIINKSKLFLKQETEEKINQLCVWIEQNCANPIGFEDLTRQSGFDVNELMTLFGVYKKTTPMGFVRFCREMEKRKKEQPVTDLFSRSLQKKPKDLLWVQCRFWPIWESQPKHCRASARSRL